MDFSSSEIALKYFENHSDYEKSSYLTDNQKLNIKRALKKIGLTRDEILKSSDFEYIFAIENYGKKTLDTDFVIVYCLFKIEENEMTLEQIFNSDNKYAKILSNVVSLRERLKFLAEKTKLFNVEFNQGLSNIFKNNDKSIIDVVSFKF